MIKAGLFVIGLDTYWGQFEGLLENLKKYQEKIKQKVEVVAVEVAYTGMVDYPINAHAAHFLKFIEVDIVLLYVSTCALLSTVLPMAQKLKLPVIIFNLQPVP